MQEQKKICEICERSQYEVKLISAVSEGKLIDICEECAFIENLPIVRKPTPNQLKEGSEKHQNVRSRLMRMSGLDKETNEAKKIFDKIKQEKFSENKEKPTYSEILNKIKEKNIPVNLMDNFHWEIQMARRRRKMSQAQLANSIGEAEETISLIEKANLPEQPEKVINKLEQFFNINLKQNSFFSEKTRDKENSELENVNEEEIKKESPAKILKFDKETIKNITIADLVEMKKEKERREAEEIEDIINAEKEKPIFQQKDFKKEERDKEGKKESMLGKDIEILDSKED